MNPRISVPERALQLATESLCRNLEDIRRQLSREGFTSVDAHLSGHGFRVQLREVIASRKAAAAAAQSDA